MKEENKKEKKWFDNWDSVEVRERYLKEKEKRETIEALTKTAPSFLFYRNIY